MFAHTPHAPLARTAPPQVRTTFSQASLIAEDVLQSEPDAVKVLFNKFHSAISFKPTVCVCVGCCFVCVGGGGVHARTHALV